MKRLLAILIIASLALAGCDDLPLATAPTPISSPAIPTLAPQPTVEPTQAPPSATPALETQPSAPTATEAATSAPTESPTQAPTEPPTLVPTLVPTATPGTIFITYQDFEIVPGQVTISIGATVVFLIKGHLHQPYNFDPPDTFESPAGLSDSTSWAYTFNEPGTVTIRCGYHSKMVATVIVTP